MRDDRLPIMRIFTAFFFIETDYVATLYFPRKNGHVILGFFRVLSKESGDSVPRTPWDFSLWTCTGGNRPLGRWAARWRPHPPFARLHRRSRCVPAELYLRCSIDSLG